MLNAQLVNHVGRTLVHSFRQILWVSRIVRPTAGVLLILVVVLGGLRRNGVATTSAAELQPLDSSGWQAKTELHVEDRAYLLGENIHLELTVTNPQTDAIQISSGSDYRAAPRATRFKVLAFDENGMQVSDPYPNTQSAGGIGYGKRPLQPGKSRSLSFALGRYCDFQKPGIYTLRVYHDLGLDEESVPNKLPTGEHLAPIAEAKITFAMPGTRQARRLVTQMAEVLRNDATRNGWNKDDADFATLRQPIYLPYLMRLTADSTEAVARAAVQAIGEIATPEATTMLVELLDHRVTAVSTQAIFSLLRRLPYPALMDPTMTPGRGERTRYLALRSWSGEHRDQLLEIAQQLTVTNSYGTLQAAGADNVLHGLKIYRALGRASDYRDFMRFVGAAISTNATMDHLLHQYADTAWTLFCDRAKQPPKDLQELLKITGEPDSLTFLRLLELRPDYRPDDWEDRLADLLHESSPSVRLFATQHVPFPISKKVAYWVTRNIVDDFGKSYRHNGELTLHPPLQVASLKLAEKTRSLYFVPSIRKSMEEAKDAKDFAVFSAAKRALSACTRPAVEPVTERDAWPPIDFPAERIEELVSQSKRADTRVNAVKQLRAITGMDFGDAVEPRSRRGWSNWGARERSNTRNAANGRREFLVHGRITEPNGNPVPHAWAQVYVSSELGREGGTRTAYTLADEKGRYLLRFGFYKKEPSDLPLVAATIRASDASKFHLRPEDEPSLRVLSRIQLDDDPLLGVKKEDAIYPGQPIEMNFTLYPATRLRVDVVDADGQPAFPHKLSLRYQEADKDEPTLRGIRLLELPKDKYYYTYFLPPRNAELVLQATDDAQPIASATLSLAKPGDYHVRLLHSPDAAKGEKVSLTVLEAPEAEPQAAATQTLETQTPKPNESKLTRLEGESRDLAAGASDLEDRPPTLQRP